MAGTERVLVDTSAIYAIRSTRDRFHGSAKAAYEHLMNTNQELWTTSYVLVETVALMHRRLGFEVVAEFSNWLRDSSVKVSWVDSSMHEAAWNQFMAEQGRGLSFVDWTIALASREMGAAVFTFDAGIASQGVPVVPR